LRVLLIGDIMGKPGRLAVKQLLPELIGQRDIDFVIANGENSAGGFGINTDIARALLSYGVDAITGGNHFWDRREIEAVFEEVPEVIRPANYPPSLPGYGSKVYETRAGKKVGVLNLQGRTFMTQIDCPFRTAEKEITELRQKTNLVIVDFHAEATSEKQAMGYYLDGRAGAVVGTHTHVQSADEKILPNKTGFITDVGMTGAHFSVIGMEYAGAIARFLTGTPKKFKVATKDVKMCSVLMEFDSRNGTCLSIERLQIDAEAFGDSNQG
jgi:metallophosphoesterase (TIGR00282 family)